MGCIAGAPLQCSEVLHNDFSQMDHASCNLKPSLVIFSIVYNLLLAVLQLWFVLTVPEDFKLFTLVGICKTFGSGLSDSILLITDADLYLSIHFTWRR